MGRAISPAMAANLSALAARTVAAQASKPKQPPAPGSADSSDAVQLKPFVVREERVPNFKERELLTDKGKLELARKRYPGIGSLGDAASLRRLEEDFAAERRQELREQRKLFEIGGDKLPPGMKKKLDEAMMGPSGLSFEIGEPFRPPK